MRKSPNCSVSWFKCKLLLKRNLLLDYTQTSK